MDTQKLNYLDNDIKPQKINTPIFSFSDIDVKPIICSSTNTDMTSNYESTSVTPVGLNFSENYIDLKHSNGNLDESEFILQKQTEIDIKPTLCEICKKCFTSDCVIESSFKTQSICKSCEEKLPVIIHSQTLGKSVTSEAHVCTICTQSFKNSFDLKWHLLIHPNDHLTEIVDDNSKKEYLNDCDVKNEKLHSCEFCHESFTDKPLLEEHYLNHFKHRFSCNKCNASFKEGKALSRHKYIHHKTEKQITKYKCKLCSTSYSTERLLNSHNLLHMKVTNKIHTIRNSRLKFYGSTNKNKHTLAKYCSRINPTADDVKQHKLFHQGDVVYICDDCNFCFSDKTVLSKHILTHTVVDIQFSGPSNC